ncbi:MAG: hypothetical protein ACOC2Y_01095 [Spirochaetota bacterium]
MKNPILEESAEVYLRRREYMWLHISYAAAIALFAVLLWPIQGFMTFFRTETIPSVFQATVIVHLLAVNGISLYVGLDRLADDQIIHYSEWLERTNVPLGVLFRGKIIGGVVHTLFIVAAGFPFVLVASGPAGIPFAAVVASEVIVFIAGLLGRICGMLMSHVGETRYIIRVIGAWLYVAFFYLGTLQIYRPLNPIAAVVMQHAEDSPFMQLGRTGVLDNPLVAAGAPMLAVTIVLAAVFRFSLARHRLLTGRGVR